MPDDPTFKPRLRPVDVVAISDNGETRIALRDRSGLSELALNVSRPVLYLLAQMDGTKGLEEIRREFGRAFGQPLPRDTLADVVGQLETAHFLEGPGFEAYYQLRQEQFRCEARRSMWVAALPSLPDDLGRVFREMLAEAPRAEWPGAARGIIAPHLDYPRGRPCYAAAYGALRGRPTPRRVVVLGTNHFGRSAGPVVTGSAFATPLGTTATDTRFIERLEQKCGFLRSCELDHLREHSVELQVAWLQFLFGVDSFQLVPILCSDPCQAEGVRAGEAEGVELSTLARGLAELIEEDAEDTLLVAGADLSHVGAAFGDDRVLEEAFLEEVRRRDQAALAHVERRDPDGFVACLARDDNPTRVCSAGCIYALSRVLAGAGAKATLLGYHQAVDPSAQTCVTCCAVAFG